MLPLEYDIDAALTFRKLYFGYYLFIVNNDRLFFVQFT